MDNQLLTLSFFRYVSHWHELYIHYAFQYAHYRHFFVAYIFKNHNFGNKMPTWGNKKITDIRNMLKMNQILLKYIIYDTINIKYSWFYQSYNFLYREVQDSSSFLYDWLSDNLR